MMRLTFFYSWLRIALIVVMTGITGLTLLKAAPAHAGLFDDDQARQAILDLRARADNLENQLSAAQRAMVDQSNQIVQLQQQTATLRGQNEELTNQLAEMQKTAKDHFADLDQRLKELEAQGRVDSSQNVAQPGEIDRFNAALQKFRHGDFKEAAIALKNFIKQYPKSAYQPTAQYWLGNALYAQRDYQAANATLRRVAENYPTHPRAPEALLAIGQNQLEQGQKAAAQRTLQQVVAQYGDSKSAQSARDLLRKIK